MSEQSRTSEAVKIAIQMEIDGKQFYLKASQASRNDLGKRLFLQLAEEEDIHRKKFEEIYKAIQVSQAWPEISLDIPRGGEFTTLFARASRTVKPATGELEAVQTAMAMESKTEDFYQDQAQKAAFTAERNYYESLRQQERAHHAALLDYYEYLSDPAGWFTVKEHHSLDGA